MKQDEIKAAYLAAQNILVQAEDFINYQEKNKENTMALGVLALSIGEKLTKLAGMECTPATGENLALKFVPTMDAQESAMIALLLENYRAKKIDVAVCNSNLMHTVQIAAKGLEGEILWMDAFDQELELYNLMGTIAFALLNWDSRTKQIDNAAKHCLPSTNEGY